MASKPFAAALLAAAVSMTPSFAAAQDSIEDKLHFSGYGEAHYNSHELSEVGVNRSTGVVDGWEGCQDLCRGAGGWTAA